MRRSRGSITWPASGVFRVSVELGTVDGHRKRLSEGGRGSEKDAERVLASLLVRAECIAPAATQTLGDYLEHVYTPHLRRRVRQGTIRQETVDGYVYALNAHVMPYLESVPLHDLTGPKLRRWMERMEDDGVSVQQRLHAARPLRAALNEAVRRDILERAPSFALPNVPRRDLRVLSAEEAVDVLNAFSGHQAEAGVLLAIGCGLALSEFSALEWSDFDWERGTVSVRRTLHHTSKGLKYEDTKTPARAAAIAMPEFVADVLRAKRGIGPVFAATPQAIARSVRRQIARVNKVRAKTNSPLLPTIPLRDYRHTHATFLVNLGLPSTVVAQRQRHADIATTYHYYAAHALDADRLAAEGIHNMLALHLATSSDTAGTR